jgi:hypothetical protein
MPLPLIIGIGAAIAGAIGIGAGVNGGVKMKNASDTMKEAQSRNDKNLARFERRNKETSIVMDELGKEELKILQGFKHFSEVWEKIHNKPEFKNLQIGENEITAYSPKQLNEVSVGAGVLLGGLGGAAVGTAGGFAAAGATTAAVMALGTASTGTAIASLSGVAATNATLAALGGGSLAVGGGGMALGTTILGAATLGVGLLVGGVIFSIAGQGVEDKADNAYSQMLEAEKIINKTVTYLNELKATANNYRDILGKVNALYIKNLQMLKNTVENKQNWHEFSNEEKLNAENTILLVGLLYEMCKVKLVTISNDKNSSARINNKGINNSIEKAQVVIENLK